MWVIIYGEYTQMAKKGRMEIIRVIINYQKKYNGEN